MGSYKVALFLAYKSIIRGNRWALVLIILVMSLSFVNLVFTSSVLAGVTNTLDDQVVNTTLANVVVDPLEDEYYITDVDKSVQKISLIPGVTGVTSHLNTSAFIEYEWDEKALPGDRGKSGSWNVIGVEPDREAMVTTVGGNIIEGSYLDGNDRDKIVLGVEIAGGELAQSAEHLTLMGVNVGDDVRLTYPNGVQREYEVKGIFQVKEIGTADRQAFVTRAEMVSVLGRQVFSDRASQILVKIEQTGDESRFVEELNALGIPGEIRSWEDYGGMGSIVSSFDAVAALINAIGLVVAAIVMFIVIYINVLNRKRQIGILRAIGMKRNIIVRSYLAQALFYSIAGIIIGGLLFGFVIEPYFIRYPLDLPLGMVSLGVENATIQKAVWGLIGAAVLAGLIPVYTIIKTSIIKAIWGNA